MRALAIAIAILAAAPARADDDDTGDEARYLQGLKLMELDHYAEALSEFQAAYAIRQRPILLYEMGRAEQKLGHATEARGFFERYLIADPLVEVTRKSDIERRLQLFERDAPPRRSTTAVPPGWVHVRQEMRPRKDLVVAGSILLAIGYTPAFICGALFTAVWNTQSLQAAGATLLIPVLGPFISGALYPQPFWAVPWILVDGLMQAGGLAMIIAGKLTKKKVLIVDSPVTLLPQSLPGGAGLVAFGRF